MKSNNIVFSREGKLYLDSSMTQRAFSKTRLSERLNEQGILAEADGENWNFSRWNFTETASSLGLIERPGETVLFEGDAFNGWTLKDFLDAEKETSDPEEKARCTEAAVLAIRVLEEAVTQNQKMPSIGAAGIFISEDLSKILFLPYSLYDTSITCFGDVIFSECNGLFIHQNLSGNAAVNFTQAVIAYRLLTGKFPYPATDSAVRHEDCLDHNYLRIRDEVWGLNEELAFFIDSALQRSQKVTKRSKGREKASRVSDRITSEMTEHSTGNKSDYKLHFPLQLLYSELGLTLQGTVSEDKVLHPAERKSSVSMEQFSLNSKKTYQRFRKHLSVKRWFRRHGTTIKVCAGIAAAVLLFAGVYSKDKGRAHTTTGLTSVQALEMYYSSYNLMDVDSLQNSASGKEGSSQMEILSNFYVSTKQRSTYNPKDATVSPAEWINFNRELNYNMFGLTQFYIDGNKGSLYFNGPVKNTHPHALAKENGMLLNDRSVIKHNVRYYHLFSETPDSMEIMEHNDTVTLTFKGKRWTVSHIELGTELHTIDLQSFKQDWTKAMEESSQDQFKAAELLREQYPWISDASEIKEAAEYMKKNSNGLNLD